MKLFAFRAFRAYKARVRLLVTKFVDSRPKFISIVVKDDSAITLCFINEISHTICFNFISLV